MDFGTLSHRSFRSGRISVECWRIARRNSMPYVQVTWVAGRSPEQKRKLAERITQALIEDGRAKRENIQVTFVDLPPTDYAEAGVTVADQKRTP
ncbi:MAG: 4-oxalocrotonate tautomerase family protein [Candidatus Acidiferrales bacterium]